MSVQALNLLLGLQARPGLAVLLVAHDLRLVRHISHRVAVMYLGSVVEGGPSEALFRAPRHPYTRALLDAAPDLDPARRTGAAAARGDAAVAEGLDRGDYAPLRLWLTDRLHRHGRSRSPSELLRGATGSGLDPAAYLAALADKVDRLAA